MSDAPEPPKQSPADHPGDDARATADPKATDEPTPSDPKPVENPKGTADAKAADDAKAKNEEERAQAKPLSHNLTIQSEVAERNVYRENTINVTGDFIGSSDTARSEFVPAMDVTAEVATARTAFVPPPHFPELVRALEENHVVLLTGGGCGNRTAAGAALHEAERGPILELPAGNAAKTLINKLERICRDEAKIGVLIESIDQETLRGFAGFELRRLKDALIKGRASLILTTQTPEGVSIPAPDLCTIDGVSPDAEQVIRSLARVRGISQGALTLALAAFELLPPPVTPTTAVALVNGAPGRPPDAAEELAALVSGQSPALDEWLGKRPTAEHVASLTAAATLDGLPSADIEAEAARLAELLEGEIEPSTEQRRFGTPDRGWPAGVVGFGRRGFSTNFGVPTAEVIQICPPHQRDLVVRYLWKNLDGQFRRSFLDWLQTLSECRSDRVRSGAAITAGVMFTEEPIIAERELLRPWALDGRPRQRLCAGLALGVPVILGSDPAPARALAHAWATSDNLRFRRVAIAAYGGALGAWDPLAAAPMHLWQIGAESPDLQWLADVSLAFLVAAGEDAGLVRWTVIDLLAGELEEKPARRRAYELLPLLFDCLTDGNATARQSFAALLSDTERDSLAKLAGMLARAFDSPKGHASARAALGVLLDAQADNHIDRNQLNRLIREMKATAPRGRLAALGSQVERALNAERRGDSPRSDVASDLHATFYSSGLRRPA
jgi:hypothetical protein